MSKNLSKSDARKERRGERARSNKHAPLIATVSHEDRHQTLPTRIERVSALNDAQRAYDAAIRSSSIIFGIGPAGTGKTWFAVQRAAEALKSGEIEKIYLTRPNVEVGRGFGFLPGELEEKYEPYIAPLREALEEAFGASHLEFLLKRKIIDSRPLAFMRGATMKNGWLIADEMQNATRAEMIMLLSRIGENAKFVINGDLRQRDLPDADGLEHSIERLRRLDAVKTVRFGRADIVRSGLCQAVIEAFED